jgi:predicted ribosome quality control (RQC) complex YloA/Tae2 family protein
VLLPQRGKEPPHSDDVEFAAGLAVRFSKAKAKGRVEVIVADVKDVFRSKGALPGQVRIRHYRTVLSEGPDVSVMGGEYGDK